MRFQRLIASQREKEAADAKSLVGWCSHQISLSQPAKVAALHSAMGKFDGSLSATATFDDKIAVYENFLSDCRDAIQSVRDQAKNEVLKSQRAEMDADAPLTQAQLLHSYLCYVRLTKTNERYLMMLNQYR